MNDRATLIAPNTVRLERLLPGPVERVWTYLTDSEKRATWFCGGEFDLRVGGRIRRPRSTRTRSTRASMARSRGSNRCACSPSTGTSASAARR